MTEKSASGILLRRLLALVFLLAASFAVLAAGAQPASDPHKVSVQLNWKHQFEFAAFYAALEQGYYRQAGLEVAILEGGPGIDAVREVVEGRATFGVAASALVVDRYRGLPVVALAALMQHSPVGLMALRRDGLNSVHDLAGQPVAVDAHSRDEIEAYLKASGVPAERIKLVEQTDWTLATLHNGKDAAKSIYLSNEPFLIRGKEHKYLLLTPRSAGIDLFGNMLFSTKKSLRQNPETVRAFREATLKGLSYALEHAPEITDLILQRYNTQQKSREHLLFEAGQIHELTRTDIVEPGYMSVGRWRHVVSVYAGQGKLPVDFDLDDFVFDPAPKVVPYWVIWVFGAVFAALFSALFFVVRLRRLNRRLHQEIVERQSVEESLRLQKEQFEATLNVATESIFLLDPGGIIVVVNDTAAQRLGTTRQEMVGRCAYDYFPPDAAERRRGNVDDVFRSGQPMATEDERGGRYFALNYLPIPGGDGKTRSVVVFASDISERRASEQRLQAILADQTRILENNLVGILKVRNRVILWCNPAFERIYGYSEGELVGRSTRPIFASDEAYQAMGAAYATIDSGQGFRARVEYQRKDGTLIWCDASSMRLDRKSGESIWTIIDITDQVHAQRELEVYHDHLEALVEARTIELQRAKEDAERANRAKSAFLSNMSHELRTPLHAVLSFSTLGLEKSLDTEGAMPKLHRYFDNIAQSGNRLMALLTDLLDLSKLESGRMIFHDEQTDLRALADAAVGLVAPLAGKKGIRLDTDALPSVMTVKCDAEKIAQVLRNLLSNAIKFSPEQSVITLSAELCNLPGRRAVDSENGAPARKGVAFSVSDQGIGIPEGELESVFEAFVESSNTRSAAGGTGLGLSICREIVDGHGGNIKAYNNPDGGSRFTFVLPL